MTPRLPSEIRRISKLRFDALAGYSRQPSAELFAAELQWASTGGPVLLRVEKHSGHEGADLVRASVAKVADEYAFALSVLGASPQDPELAVTRPPATP